MHRVPDSWYRALQWWLNGISLLVAGSYLALSLTGSSWQESLGLNTSACILAGAHLAYCLVIYRFIIRKSEWLAALLSMVIFSSILVVLLRETGDFSSWYYALWLAVVAIAGMFGPLVLLSYSLITTAYFVANTVDSQGAVTSSSESLIGLLACYGVATSSFLLWRNYYMKREKVESVELGKELKTEQLKSEILINSITDGVAITNIQGNIQIINPAGAKMLGWEVNEAKGLNFHSIFRFYQQEDRGEVELVDAKHPFTQTIATVKPITMPAITLAQKDPQSRIIVSMSVSPIISDGAVSGAVAIYRDVSEEKRQERQRTEFISTASHEMRTPVAAIEGYLSLALNDKVSQIDATAREFLQKAHESTEHLGELFRDLLAASKSEEGRIENHPIPVELGEFMEKLVEDMRFSAEDKGLEIEFSVASEGEQGSNIVRPLYYVYADPERIREVLTNLVTNAIKFTPKGKVLVGLRAQPTYVQISVRDTGVGIPPADVPHLFQKFYRVDSSSTRTIGGTGLGLFISRSIVELYKGQIWVESKLGQGSTFYVNLPRLDSKRAEELQGKAAAAISSPRTGRRL